MGIPHLLFSVVVELPLKKLLSEFTTKTGCLIYTHNLVFRNSLLLFFTSNCHLSVCLILKSAENPTGKGEKDSSGAKPR